MTSIQSFIFQHYRYYSIKTWCFQTLKVSSHLYNLLPFSVSIIIFYFLPPSLLCKSLLLLFGHLLLTSSFSLKILPLLSFTCFPLLFHLVSLSFCTSFQYNLLFFIHLNQFPPTVSSTLLLLSLIIRSALQLALHEFSLPQEHSWQWSSYMLPLFLFLCLFDLICPPCIPSASLVHHLCAYHLLYSF